jgi:hypothetical protein
MECLLGNNVDFDSVEYNVKSCYALGGKRIFYHEIMKAPPDELKEAIGRTVPKIDTDRINEIVLSTERISEVRKEYLIKSMAVRYERILAPALKQIKKSERTKIPGKEKPGVMARLTDAKKTVAERDANGAEKTKPTQNKNGPEL